jgi:hypothetical protein
MPYRITGVLDFYLRQNPLESSYMYACSLSDEVISILIRTSIKINCCTFLLRFLQLLVYEDCLINSSKNWLLLLGHPLFHDTLNTWYSISLYSLCIFSCLRDSQYGCSI